jgi:hypothetical protein
VNGNASGFPGGFTMPQVVVKSHCVGSRDALRRWHLRCQSVPGLGEGYGAGS